MKRQALAIVVTATLSALGACGGSDSGSTAPVGTPDPVASNLGTMNVGEVRVLTFSSASGGLTIPASQATAQYAIILGNRGVGTSRISNYLVRGNGVTPMPTADVIVPGAGVAASALRPGSGPVNAYGAAAELHLRALERTVLPLTHPGAAAARADVLAPRAAASIISPAVGATAAIKVLTPVGFNGENSKTCSNAGFTTTQGVVRAIGSSGHAVVVSDVSSPGGGFTTADYQAIADEFDSLTYPTDVNFFGTPRSTDTDPHIVLYYTPAVNQLTPAGQAATSGYVGGFFFAGDLYPPSTCVSSNQGKIFYLLAPDPAGTYGNRFTTAFIRNVTRGTVAHEFQHMINAGGRYVAGTNVPFEAIWLDEGLAHFAEDNVGRVALGIAPTHTMTTAEVNAMDANTYDAYFFQNFTRAKYYIERPDTTGAIVSDAKASANIASRGAAWSLLRYVADWFSGGDPATFTRKLVAGPDTGVVNLAKSANAPLDTLLAHWLVTLYTDHQSIANLPAQYNYISYNYQSIISGTPIGNESTSRYLPVTPIATGNASVNAALPPSSAMYFVTPSTRSADRTVTIASSDGTPSADPNGRVYVVRLH